MAEFIDYYAVLGVEFSASTADIKKAYYTLAKKHHSDRGGNDTTMAQINAAHDILGNDKQRNDYDELWRQYYGGASANYSNSQDYNSKKQTRQRPHAKPQHAGRYAADFEGNPAKTATSPEDQVGNSYSYPEILHVVLKWLWWHPKFTVPFGIFFLLWLIGIMQSH